MAIYSGDQNVDIGLADFVSLMALPTWYWKDGTKFSKLDSIDNKARDQMLSLMNESNLTQDLTLEEVLAHCKTLKLMALAKHPSNINNRSILNFR